MNARLAPQTNVINPSPINSVDARDDSPQPHHVATKSRVSDANMEKMEILIIKKSDELSKYVSLWQDLADDACEPNVFYEPWMLLPALKAFPNPAPEFYLVFEAGHGPETGEPRLCGLFPVQRKRRYKGLRMGVLSLWNYLYCALCTPLIRKGQEAETISAMLEYCASEPKGTAILEWNYVSADGPFAHALNDVLYERLATTYIDECWTRAVLRPKHGVTSDEYLRNGISRKARKEYKRKENRLSEAGKLEYIRYGHESGHEEEKINIQARLEDFLRLEAGGWKGKEGSAFNCDPSHREFFLSVTREAYRMNRLTLTELRIDGQPIASMCDLTAGDCSFAFKIGFDESYSRFSPGLLLEIEGVRQMHLNPKVGWMDSCAVRDHFMINRLWSERRMLQNLVIATGKGQGEFVVASLPLLRHFKRVVSRRRLENKSENKDNQ